MKPINTLTVNGESYVICDPNAVTLEQVDAKLEQMAQAVLAALPDASQEEF